MTVPANHLPLPDDLLRRQQMVDFISSVRKVDEAAKFQTDLMFKLLVESKELWDKRKDNKVSRKK